VSARAVILLARSLRAETARNAVQRRAHQEAHLWLAQQKCPTRRESPIGSTDGRRAGPRKPGCPGPNRQPSSIHIVCPGRSHHRGQSSTRRPVTSRRVCLLAFQGRQTGASIRELGCNLFVHLDTDAWRVRPGHGAPPE
jgi:hypothetical protein